MYQTMNNMKRVQPIQNPTNNHARNAIRNTNRPKINENFRRPGTITDARTIEKYPAIITKPPQQENIKSLWGRPLWFSLHYGALNYPESPDRSMQEMMIGFIKGLPIMIPCDRCKNPAYEYINKFKQQELLDVTSSSEKLFRFFWKFHNDVNLRSGKPTMTLKDAYLLFENNPRTAL